MLERDLGLQLQPVKKIHFYVHPFFCVNTDSDPPTYITGRNRMFSNVVASAPSSPDHVSVISPMGRDLKYSVYEYKHRLKIFQKPDNWMNLYKELRKNTRYPDNIFFVKDILQDGWSGQRFADEFRAHNFDINDDTEILIGGEWLDVCVRAAAMVLHRGTNFRDVSIDTNVSLPDPRKLAIENQGDIINEVVGELRFSGIDAQVEGSMIRLGRNHVERPPVILYEEQY